ncbi:MAG: hypothetical protein ACTSWC_10635 [Promethearchaeota archaeon]
MGLFTRKTKETSEPQNGPESFYIKRITLNGARDFVLLQQNLLEGNLMIVNFRPLARTAHQSNSESSMLHDQLQRIKKYCLRTGGSVTKLKESLLLITPNNLFRIER